MVPVFLVACTVLCVLPIVIIVSTILIKQKRKADVGNMPAIFQPFSVFSIFVQLSLVPKKLFGYEIIKFDRDFAWQLKYEDLYPFEGKDYLAITSPERIAVLVADAELVKKICANRVVFPKPIGDYGVLNIFGLNIVTLEGDDWKRHRRIANPSFSERNNLLVHEQTLRHTLDMIAGWEKHNSAPTGKGYICRVDQDMIKLTLYVISGAGFGKVLNWEASDEVPAGHKLSYHRALEVATENIVLKIALPKFLYKLPIKKLREIDVAFKEFEIYMQEIVQDARNRIAPNSSSNEGTADLLAALVQAGQTKGEDDMPVLSDSEIFGDTFVFLLAGHETTAHTLIFGLALLAMHPDVQGKLFQSITEVLGSRLPNYDDFDSLKYSLAVFNESLRMYPPVVLIPKIAGQDTEIDGHAIKKGTNVDVHVAALHRSPKYWTNPNAFYPERFLGVYNKNAFIPFSDGMRSCLGKRFAQVEAVCILTVLVQKFRIELADPSQKDTIMDCRSILTLTPKNPVSLRFIPR